MKLKEYLEELNDYLETYPEAEDWEVLHLNSWAENEDEFNTTFARVKFGPLETEILLEDAPYHQIIDGDSYDFIEKYGKDHEDIAIKAGMNGCTGPDHPNAIIL